MINQYGVLNKEVNCVKREADKFNKAIKTEMKEKNLDEVSTGTWQAKFQVRKSESLDEEKVIEILKRNNIKGIIKRKEYVDESLLEDAIYAGKLNQDILNEISSCRVVKETIALTIKEI
jgi:hypothetical protein